MRGLRATVAVVALVGAGAFGTGVLRSQDDGSVLHDAIEAQQQHSLDAAGAADAGTELEALEPAPELLTEEELDGLVAPVALYPDALLAQVLVAATFPLQVAKADQLIEASADMSEDELSEALARQEFDPSVMVLMSGFPTVISRMADDIDWTDRLGRAMLDQDDDVLAAVQRMRADAEAQGNLTSNAAQVIEEDEGQIYIKPADPEVVYVPTYDPQTVYTTAYGPAAPAPYVAQTSSNPLANPLTAGALAFGGALLVTELFGDDDHNDHDKGGWDDYWRGDRPIDWDDRQFYPRPVWRAGAGPTSWSRERDRNWDRRADRWRRDDAEAARAYQLGRQDTLKEMQRDAGKRAERMREAARTERARAEAQRERAGEQRRKAVSDREKAERAAAAQRREEAAEAAKARRERAEQKARDDERSAAAARRDKEAAAAARRDEKAAAGEARKQDAAKRAKAEERAQKTRDDAQAKRKAADRQEAAKKKAAAEAKAGDDARARRKAKDETEAEDAARKVRGDAQAKRKAADEQAKAAVQQRAKEQRAAAKRKAERQAERKCERNPEAKGCGD